MKLPQVQAKQGKEYFYAFTYLRSFQMINQRNLEKDFYSDFFMFRAGGETTFVGSSNIISLAGGSLKTKEYHYNTKA